MSTYLFCWQPVFYSHTKSAPATSHQPASSTFPSQQISTSHQPQPAEQEGSKVYFSFCSMYACSNNRSNKLYICNILKGGHACWLRTIIQMIGLETRHSHDPTCIYISCQYYNNSLLLVCSACSSQKLDAVRTNPKRWSNI